MADVSAENALHEACHATVARLLGIPVVSATAALPKPLVRTLSRLVDLEKITMVDLAGLAVDTVHEAIEADMRMPGSTLSGLSACATVWH